MWNLANQLSSGDAVENRAKKKNSVALTFCWKRIPVGIQNSKKLLRDNCVKPTFSSMLRPDMYRLRLNSIELHCINMCVTVTLVKDMHLPILPKSHRAPSLVSFPLVYTSSQGASIWDFSVWHSLVKSVSKQGLPTFFQVQLRNTLQTSLLSPPAAVSPKEQVSGCNNVTRFSRRCVGTPEIFRARRRNVCK